jgi:hypothetical protein
LIFQNLQVPSIAEHRYDPKKVLEEFLDIQYHQEKLRELKIAIDEDQKNHERLDSQNSSLLKSIGSHSRKGFGIKELKRLLDTIMAITRSNQISHWLAIDKFFNDIETQYDAKLGFESENDKLVKEIKMLEEERKKNLENLRNQPFIGPNVMGLLNRDRYLGVCKDISQYLEELLFHKRYSP